jgi:drug/metabolite transporter (DMT)-like permease
MLVIAVVGAAGAAGADGPPIRWTRGFVFAILFLGVVTNALGFLGQAWAQKRVPPTRTAVLFSGEPVFAALFGVWLAGETMGAWDVLGGAIVMAAVALTVLKPRREVASDAAAR